MEGALLAFYTPSSPGEDPGMSAVSGHPPGAAGDAGETAKRLHPAAPTTPPPPRGPPGGADGDVEASPWVRG